MSMIEASIKVCFPGYELNVEQDMPGEGITGIFGTSGSGKSTFLRSIAGLERPVNSRIVVRNEVWQDDKKGIFIPAYKRAVGFVFQDAALFPHLSVEKNLHFGKKRIPSANCRIEADYVTELLGIAQLLQRKPDTLSGGEKQRVAIARALLTCPLVLLMDEPLASLDASRKAEIIPYLNRLNEELDIPVLYVSHAIDEVISLTDHLVLLENGRVISSGPTSQVVTRLDLPIAQGSDAAAVIQGSIVSRDKDFHLNTVAFSGGEIYFPSSEIEPGRPVRLRIQASDVSLTLDRAENTSILNILPVTVQALRSAGDGLVMVELDAGGTPLLCRLTAKSASNLALEAGKALYAQIKAVAVVD